MFKRQADEQPPNYADSRLHRVVARLLPTSGQLDGAHLFTRRDGGIKLTPLFPVLVIIELTDVVFAADSILAIFAGVAVGSSVLGALSPDRVPR